MSIIHIPVTLFICYKLQQISSFCIIFHSNNTQNKSKLKFGSVSAINFNKLVQQHFPEAPRSASYPSCSDPSKTSLYPPISCAITMKHSIKDVSAISSAAAKKLVFLTKAQPPPPTMTPSHPISATPT